MQNSVESTGFETNKYIITHAHIKIDLGHLEADVNTILTYSNINPDNNVLPPLRLRGKNIELKAISLDTEYLNAQQYTISQNHRKLTIFNAPSTGIIIIHNTAKITSDRSIGGLLRLGEKYILAECANNGIERITYFIRDHSQSIIFTTEITALITDYPTLLAPGIKLYQFRYGANKHTASWQDMEPKTSEEFCFCSSDLISIPDVFENIASTDNPSVQIFIDHKYLQNAEQVIKTLHFMIDWHKKHVNVASKFAHYYIAVVPVKDEFIKQQQNVFFIDANTLLVTHAQETDDRYLNLVLQIAQIYFRSQQESMRDHWRVRGAPYDRFYEMHFDLNANALNYGYGFVMNMYLEFFERNLKSSNNTTLIEMPLFWIDTIKNILNDRNLSPSVRSYLLELPSISSIITKSTHVDIDQIQNLHDTASSFIAQSLADEFYDICEQILSNKYNCYSLEVAGNRQLLYICLKYLHLYDPVCLSDKIEQLAISELSLTHKVNFFSILAVGNYDNKSLIIKNVTEHLQNLSNSENIPARIMLILQAIGDSSDIHTKLKVYVEHEANHFYDKFTLINYFVQHNPKSLHNINGRGYELLVDTVIAIQKQAPKLALKLLSVLDDWWKYDLKRKHIIYNQYDKIMRFLSIDDAIHAKVISAMKMWDPKSQPLDEKQTPQYLLIKYKQRNHFTRQSRSLRDIGSTTKSMSNNSTATKPLLL